MLLNLLKKLVVSPREWVAPEDNESLLTSIKSKFESQISEAYQTVDKMDRYEKMGEIKDAAFEEFVSEDDSISEDEVKNYIKKIEKSTVRERILAGEPRIDGRDNSTVRELAIETGVLENTHGSALFTRGETQALVVTTLGSKRDAQLIETLESNDRIEDHFMLHYNFPSILCR